MAAISFKSVGDLSSNPRDTQTAQAVPVGISTPVVNSRKVGGPFEMSNIVIDQLIDNFRNMLLTNHGERLPLYDYGANLRSLLTERLTQTAYDDQAMKFIKATTEKYMPYVNLNSFETKVLTTEKDTISRIKIKIDFVISRASESLKTIEIILENIG